MTISTACLQQFMQVVEELVKRGLTFRADVQSLVITLLGGF